MIEIKNKRMILFREDRMIGAKGDVDTSNRKFILDAVQGEYDLSEMIPWIKIDPKFPGEGAYDQVLKREFVGDKIVLTWSLTAKNLQRAGEISAQIIFASPAYFIEDELENILGSSPFLPTPVLGISAPVWQTYPETFVIEESISDTEGYKEMSKNVLVSAVADALASADEASSAALESMSSAEDAKLSAQGAQDALSDAREAVDDAQLIRAEVEGIKANIELDCDEIRAAKENVSENLEASQECVQLADSISHQTYNYMEMAKTSSENAEKSANNVLNTLAKARNYRLIYKKTLSAEDTDCYGFEITQDEEGNPFSLSEFTVYAHVPPMSGVSSVYTQVYIQPDNILNSDGERKYGIVIQFAGISSSKETYSRVECANKGRWRANLTKSTAWSQNGDSVYQNGGVCSSSRFADGKNATAIIFSSTSGVNMPFPEGTEFEIWGVDSIKEAE